VRFAEESIDYQWRSLGSEPVSSQKAT